MQFKSPPYILLVIILLFASILPVSAASSQQGNVTVDQLRVRSGPGTNYEVLHRLSQGDEVAIVQTDGSWYQIKTSAITGWVSREYIRLSASDVSKVPTTNQSKGNVLVDNLNVRLTPSTSGQVLGKLEKGTTIFIHKIEDGWINITYNGQKAWVSSEFISIQQGKSKAESEKNTSSPNTTGTITATSLNVRNSASLEGEIIGSVKKGEIYNISAEENNWTKIKLNNGKSGWVASWFITKTTPKATNTIELKTKQLVTVMYDGTNIRSNASTSGDVISRANNGDTLEAISLKNNWYEIKLSNGKKGYIAGWLVQADGMLQQVENPGAEKYLKDKIIVIDPGHGGKDQGATGLKGSYEKQLTLSTANLLYEKLNAAGANVVLTRNNDSYLSLTTRVGVSHQYGADAFISLHFDSIMDSSVRGITSYFYHDYQASLAEAVHKEVMNQTKLKDRGARFGDYHVLRENKRASVLLELGYLSNSAEEMLVTTQSYQQKAATGIYQGLAKYFKP